MFLILVGVAVVAWALTQREERKHTRQGYWVEYVSLGQLRANENGFAVVYHELDLWQFFYGKISERDTGKLLFPDDASWQAQAPDWLNGKRELVLNRIQENVERIEIVTVPEFPAL